MDIFTEIIVNDTLPVGTYRTWIALDLRNNEIFKFDKPIRMDFGRGWGIRYWVKSRCGDWVCRQWKDFETNKAAKAWIKTLVSSGRTVTLTSRPDSLLRFVNVD